MKLARIMAIFKAFSGTQAHTHTLYKTPFNLIEIAISFTTHCMHKAGRIVLLCLV